MKYIFYLITFLPSITSAQKQELKIVGSSSFYIDKLEPSPGDRFFYHFDGKAFCNIDGNVKLTICEFQRGKKNYVWIRNITMSDAQFKKLQRFLWDDKIFNCSGEQTDEKDRLLNFTVHQVTNGNAYIGTPVDVALLRKRVKEFFKSK